MTETHDKHAKDLKPTFVTHAQNTTESIKSDILDQLFCSRANFPEVATMDDFYLSLAYAVRNRLLHRWINTAHTYFTKGSRTVAYLSAEYLIGPQLGNNLINLGIHEQARRALSQLGISLDGRIADSKGKSQWITGPKSRAQVQDLRGGADAIMVGRTTANADDPSLLCKARKDSGLYRVVVDSSGTLALNAKLLNDDHVSQTIIATTSRCSVARRKLFAKKGAQVLTLPSSSGHVSVKALFNELGRMGLLHVMCEGGGELAFSLIDAGLVDEYLFFVAPLVMGGRSSVPAVAGKGWSLESAPRLRFVGCDRVGDDMVLRATPRR